MRVGIGHDTHRFVEGRPLVLAGVTIPWDRGLLGHSDADVVLHAIADALLGAAGLGDIGEIFPDSDEHFRGIDSCEIVRAVMRLVAAAGWRPVNLDVIVHVEAPKLGPYKTAMRNRLAELLDVDATVVNVKAKTGERVGPIGRGEAVSCHAVVLLESRKPSVQDGVLSATSTLGG